VKRRDLVLLCAAFCTDYGEMQDYVEKFVRKQCPELPVRASDSVMIDSESTASLTESQQTDQNGLGVA
jgi:hypothetical protein